MSNADTAAIGLAEQAGMSLATFQATRGECFRGVRELAGDQRIPGNITTPPEPGAVQIGGEDC